MKKLKLTAFILMLILIISTTDLSAQTRIRFARGRTSTTVSGQMGYGERRFVLGAKYGQYLSANVSSRNGCVKFSNGSTETSYVTKSGNNYLYLVNACQQTSFSLTVSINYGSD